MKDLLSQIEAEAYVFKDPWRATNKSLTIIVPIVAETPGTRNYVVLEEVKDKVKIVDTGSIDRTRIDGDVDKPTFIRGGTMLKGATQERATQYGIVVVPQKAEQIPVHCIHASRGIRSGTFFAAGGYAPRQVYASMLSHRNQSRTWQAASNYSTMARASGDAALHLASVPHDDLVGVVETVQKFREDLKEILKQIPDYVNQVGTVLIDPDGVVGLEMYDHPDSWKAFSESIIKSYADALTREDKTGIFKPDLEVAIVVIKAFMEEIKKAEEEEVFDKNNAKTVILKAEGFVGEYTTINGKTIHFLITRQEKEILREPERRPTLIRRRIDRDRTAPMVETPPTVFYTTASPDLDTDWAERLQKKMKRGIQVLTTLEQPKTWTKLTSDLQMSKATLSSHLKNLQQMGVVEKYGSPNGVTRYGLTGLGQELKKKVS